MLYDRELISQMGSQRALMGCLRRKQKTAGSQLLLQTFDKFLVGLKTNQLQR